MRRKIIRNIPVFVLGLVFVIGGTDIIVRGKMRNLLLDDEKYLIGGVVLLVGIYALISVFKNK